MEKSARIKLAAVVIAALTLVGCSATSGFADLDRDATAEDSGPDDLPDYALADFDIDSMRFAAEADDYRLYLAEGTTDPVCVLIYRNSLHWMSSCSSEMSTMGSPELTVMIVGNDMPNKDGWTRVSENLVVEDFSGAIAHKLGEGTDGDHMEDLLGTLTYSDSVLSATVVDGTSSRDADELCEALYTAGRDVSEQIMTIEVSSSVAMMSRRSDNAGDSECGLPHP